jgi:hypothetical protein
MLSRPDALFLPLPTSSHLEASMLRLWSRGQVTAKDLPQRRPFFNLRLALFQPTKVDASQGSIVLPFTTRSPPPIVRA